MKNEPLSRKLTFGIFYLLTGSSFATGMSVITLAFLARKLTVEDFGLYSAILAFVGLFQFLSDLGVNRALLRDGATNLEKAKVSYGNALYIKGILILPMMLFISLTGYISGYKGENLLVVVFLALSSIFDSFGSIFISVRRILGDFKIISFFKGFRSLINLLIIFISLQLNNTVLSLSFGLFLVSLISVIIALLNTSNLLKPKLDKSLILEMVKESIIFSLNDFFSKTYIKISIVLLSVLTELKTVGLFSVAIRVTKIVSVFPRQVRVAMLPTIYRILDDKKGNNEKSEKSEENKNEKTKEFIETHMEASKRVFGIINKYMTILVVPFVLMVFYFSDSLIEIVFGSKYNSSIPFVKILTIFIYLRFIQTPVSLYYLGLNKHKEMVIFQGIGNALLVLFCFILIPLQSVYGACIAIILSELIYFSILVLYGNRFMIWTTYSVLKSLFIPSLMGLITLGFIHYLLDDLNLLFKVILLPIIYLILLLLSGQYTKKDKELILKILKGRRESAK